jgi:hypothetical protein
MRAVNRIVSLLLAAAIAVAGVLTVVEIIAATTDNDPVIVKWHGAVNALATNSWAAAGPRVAAIVLMIVGVILLFLALRRGKPATVALSSGTDQVDMTTTRRSLQRSLSVFASSVDGIADAKAKVKRRKIVVAARSNGPDRETTRAELTKQLQKRLDSLSLADARRLKVKVAAAPDPGTPEPPVLDEPASAHEPSDGSSDERTTVGSGAVGSAAGSTAGTGGSA